MTTFPRPELHDIVLRHSLVVDRTPEGIRAHCLRERDGIGSRRGCEWSWSAPAWDGAHEYHGRSLHAGHLVDVLDVELVVEVKEEAP